MAEDSRAQADSRLDAALAARGLADPRPTLRERLKSLRSAHPEAFERARRHYEEHTLPRLTDGEPVEAWIDYARALGELTAIGRLVCVDASGRARDYTGTVARAELVLFVPAEDTHPAFVAVEPAEPSAAQQASIDLLVRGRVEL